MRLLQASRRMDFEPREVGWPLGHGKWPRCGQLWVPYDRTAGVFGPQGSGKTLDILSPALLSAPGPAMATLTKVDDLLLTMGRRQRQGPCVVLDPFGLAPGLPSLVWDPIAGCVDSVTAERRAKAFTAGTIQGASGAGDSGAARFYAGEAAKVLQCYLHAAALTGRTLDDVLRWVAKPQQEQEPEEILARHPHAAPYWAGLLHGALHGDDRTAGNTVTTLQQACALFFQASTRERCVPNTFQPATDLREILQNNGTIYLLGREDPYASASPLMTAVAETVLDVALDLANASPHGRLCPPMLSVLDELPSTAPLPTLRTRMANERALGLAFIYATQTRAQLTTVMGEEEARALFALTNVLVMFGGSKDAGFNKEISDLIGQVQVTSETRQDWNTFSLSRDDIDVLRPEDIRQLPPRTALVLAENGRPIIARLDRCIDGEQGKQLKADQQALREQMIDNRREMESLEDRQRRALNAAAELGLDKGHPAREEVTTDEQFFL